MNRRCIRLPSGLTAYQTNDVRNGDHDTTILYLHGGPGHPEPDVADRFGYSGPMVTYSQFGCGGSEEKGEYTAEIMVAQLREFIAAMFRNGEEIILAGASWGGTLACMYVDLYGTEGIKGIILISPLISVKDNARMWEGVMRDAPQCIIDSVRKADGSGFLGENNALAHRYAYAQRYGQKVANEYVADSDFGRRSKVYCDMWGMSETECTGSLRDTELEGALGRLDVPVLYITGDHDIHLMDDVERYCSRIGDITLKVLKDCGHITHHMPERKAAINDFVSRLEPHPDIRCDLLDQDDLDMILDPDCPHDTIGNLMSISEQMDETECLEECRRYLEGDGRPQSYYSARVFMDAYVSRVRSRWNYPGRMCDIQTRYSGSDSERRLTWSDVGWLETCCDDFRE